MKIKNSPNVMHLQIYAKINLTQKLKFGDGMMEKIVGKKENMLVTSNFPFPILFSKLSFLGSLKLEIVL